jgi:hypothetical protein
MKREEDQISLHDELSDEDKDIIRRVFHAEVVPKLLKLDGRLGTISCEFAGEEYKNWSVQFKSVGDDFEIVDFEYDEEGEGIDLDV